MAQKVSKIQASTNKHQTSGDQSGAGVQVEQRRERGRAAQAAFRKRQIDTIRQQEEQLQSLESALTNVTSACSKLEHAADLAGTLGHSAVPLTLVSDVVKQLQQALTQASTDRPQQRSRMQKFRSDRDNPSSVDDASKHSQDEDTSVEGQISPPANLSQALTIQGGSDALRFPISSGSKSDQDRTYQFLADSISIPPLTRTVARSLVPVDTVSYLSNAQHAQQTFAGKLYWTTMSLAYQWITTQGWLKLPAAKRMFEYHLRYHNRDIIQRRIQTRLLMHHSAIAKADQRSAEAAEALLPSIQRLIIEDMMQAGGDVSQYLDSKEVELYLRRKYIDPDNWDMSMGLNPEGMTADQTRTAILEQLAPRAICFGDGPKWHIDDLDRTTESFTISFPTWNFTSDLALDSMQQSVH